MWMCLHCAPRCWRTGGRADLDTHMWDRHRHTGWPSIELVNRYGHRLAHDGSQVLTGGLPVPGRVIIARLGLTVRIDAWLVDTSPAPAPVRVPLSGQFTAEAVAA